MEVLGDQAAQGEQPNCTELLTIRKYRAARHSKLERAIGFRV